MKRSNFISEYLSAHHFLIQWAEKALAYELLTNSGKDHQVEIALARAKILQQDFPAAETHITQALSIDYENVEAWALWGHVKYLQLDFEAAKGICRRILPAKMILWPFLGRYQRTLMFTEKPSDLHTLYIRLGAILLSESNVRRHSSGAVHRESGCFLACRGKRNLSARLPLSTNMYYLLGTRRGLLSSMIIGF